MGADTHIVLRGVRVHNLKDIDLDLPRRQLIVVCGLSGSGKSSLALDTLYTEGQRRYIESFSAHTRQFLEQLERPEAESINGIPPAVAVSGERGGRSNRATVGTATETNDYLRLLFAKVGRVVCDGCGQPVRRHSPQSVAQEVAALPERTRAMITAAVDLAAEEDPREAAASRLESGLVRVIAGDRVFHLSTEQEELVRRTSDGVRRWYVVVDRVTAGGTSADRLRDSLETAFRIGGGRCFLFVQCDDSCVADSTCEIDGRRWQRRGYARELLCLECGREFMQPDPRLFSFNSPLGACPVCEGFGNVIDLDLDLIVPDRRKSIRDGAIAPWSSRSYQRELEKLLARADELGIRVDVPFGELSEEEVRRLVEGVPESDFGGLTGFFDWLEKRKYRMHVRVFLSRWRSYRRCEACGGMRLRPEALAVRVGGLNMAEMCNLTIDEVLRCVESLEISAWEREIATVMLDQVQSRLSYLTRVGLGYLTLDRTLRTLSGGEVRRVALAGALGSSLVNMLYVLDEPSVGLHPADIDRLLDAIRSLRARNNTVVVVEHEESIIRAADHVVEIGPGAGERGGQIVFQGTPEEMTRCDQSLTGDYLAGRRGLVLGGERRRPNHGWIRLAGARGNNLKNITVEFPLGLLCVVTGVSGSGKSTLVEGSLYPALCRRLRKDAPKPYHYDDVFGDGQIEDVILVDQNPIGRSPRSNPATYLKIFDSIRAVFAETIDARTRGFTASHFSFNSEVGRCPSCRGDGLVQIDMQFLADVYMTCSHCGGTRYRDEILEVTYRGRNIAEVLQMTAREALVFFRGQAQVQSRLRRLIDVGLDYVQLGQPANTLSGGEAQRLKLAAYTSSTRRGRCLFILDEPTTGLHFADIVQLLDCFDALLSLGHSLIVVEHNLQVMRAADYIVDLGPGPGEDGGQVVVQGTPEMVARCEQSVTGRFLNAALAAAANPQSQA